MEHITKNAIKIEKKENFRFTLEADMAEGPPGGREATRREGHARRGAAGGDDDNGRGVGGIT